MANSMAEIIAGARAKTDEMFSPHERALNRIEASRRGSLQVNNLDEAMGFVGLTRFVEVLAGFNEVKGIAILSQRYDVILDKLTGERNQGGHINPENPELLEAVQKNIPDPRRGSKFIGYHFEGLNGRSFETFETQYRVERAEDRTYRLDALIKFSD